MKTGVIIINRNKNIQESSVQADLIMRFLVIYKKAQIQVATE